MSAKLAVLTDLDAAENDTNYRHQDKEANEFAAVEGTGGSAFPGRTTSDGSSVQVAVRVRPMLALEAGSSKCIEVLSSASDLNKKNVVRLGGPSGPKFTFDQVFENCSQHVVFLDQVTCLVDSCLDGYNGTILAYGQTGSGKTHTMMGTLTLTPSPTSPPLATAIDEEHAGIIPRAIREIFDRLESKRKENCETDGADIDESVDSDIDEGFVNGSDGSSCESSFVYEVRVMFLEVYGEDIRDLLNPHKPAQRLSIRDIGVEEPEVIGATQLKVESAEEALLSLTRGMFRRVTGATAMNSSSSRSHAILSLMIEQSLTTEEQNLSGSDQAMERVQTKRSKFNFVDLAGSERQKRTQAAGQRLKEGIDINKGLLVLGNVISALGDPKKKGKMFVPYRDSKLTRLLKGSLGGNHKTLMIACVSPSSNNMDESLNCLRYANRAKNIQNRAVINTDATSRLITELKEKIRALASDLLSAKFGDGYREGSFSINELQLLASGQETQTLSAVQMGNSRSNSHSQRSGHTTASAAQDMNAISQSRSLIIRSPFPRKRERNQKYADRPDSPELQGLRAQILESMSETDNIDDEVESTNKAVSFLTSKYLGTSASDAELDQNDTPFYGNVDQCKTIGNSLIDIEHSDSSISTLFSQHKLQSDILELTSSIEAKEELIRQLQNSHEKYETMRVFYESKLLEMEHLLHDKERESERLSKELEKIGANQQGSAKLEEDYRKNQEHIAILRKKQLELTRLTTVASQNQSQILRLRSDVIEMKQKKVMLQKQIAEERKTHAVEVQKLRKESMQKDRELNKLKKATDKKEHEIQKAQKMAKVRMEEVAQLRAKYKDTEKRLRMQTVKRGVMRKAGLDSVMTGRRADTQSASQILDDINFDALREFFDRKVADVGRREAIADKLAQEWETHLELQTRRDELSHDENALDKIDTQIKLTQERIRRLAAKLGKQDVPFENPHQSVTFLFDKEFQNVVKGVNSVTAIKGAAKVLFGMVVRERRRVASLAKTASILDAKIQEAEVEAASREAAFRARDGEHRDEIAALAVSQQEHIISLMNLVSEEEDVIAATEDPGFSINCQASSKLLMLANEQIAVLERRLNEVQSRRDELEAILKERPTTISSPPVHQKIKDDQNSILFSALRNVYEMSIKQSMRSECDEKLVLIMRTAKVALDRISCDPTMVVPSTLECIEGFSGRFNSESDIQRILSADSDDISDEEIPDWADDIMADLAAIAEGRIPNSLLGSPAIKEAVAQYASLSGKATDLPQNTLIFEGRSKHAPIRSVHGLSRGTAANEDVLMGKKQRQIISKQVANKLEKLGDLDVLADSRFRTPVKSRSLSTGRVGNNSQSVFERLSSASSRAGTRRNKFEKGNRSDSTDEDAHSDTGTSTLRSDWLRKKTKFRSSVSDVTGGRFHAGVRNASRDTDCRDTDSAEIDVSNSSKRESYIHQNVFERLQKTTTQSYAVKQQQAVSVTAALAAERCADDDNSATEVSKADTSGSSGFARVDEYAQQNVFERLQKTTTQAYAVKQHGNIAEKMLKDILEPDSRGKDSSSEHTNSPIYAKGCSDVFERLQKTMTQSYAGKHHMNVSEATGHQFHAHSREKDQVQRQSSASSGENGRAEVTSPSHSILTFKKASKSPGQENVFERLQKTSTMASAKKKKKSQNPFYNRHLDVALFTASRTQAFQSQSAPMVVPETPND